MNAFNPKSTPSRSPHAAATPHRSAAAAAPLEREPAVDVGAMVRRVLAHWHMVIVALLVGGLVTALVVRTRKPSFRSETVISFREGIGRTVAGLTHTGDILRSLPTKLKETLLAQQTLRGIIDEFHLYPEILQHGGYSEAVDLMRKRSDFKARSNDTFAISFEGTNGDEAQQVCSRMAAILVSENTRRWKEDQRANQLHLDQEKKRADEELRLVERDTSAFLSAHPEFTTNPGLGTEVRDDWMRKSATCPAPGRPTCRPVPALRAPPPWRAPRRRSTRCCSQRTPMRTPSW